MSQIDLQSKFPSMQPVKSAPTLTRVYGCGLGLYGRREADAETGTHVTNLCFTLLSLPLLCLRAYRVSETNRGWYFHGRVPLSTMAMTWNILLVLLVGGGVGLWRYEAYTSTPAYKAGRTMAEAAKLVEEGKLAEAADKYRRLAEAGADQAQNATVALAGLVDKCAQGPLDQCAGVYAAAAKIARRDGAVPPADLLQKGLAISDARADSDPRGNLALLNALRPLALDTRPIDTRRLPLLRKWAAEEPQNVEALWPLADLLLEQDQLDEAAKLLRPVRANLGNGEAARVLGTVLARQGDYDGAYALLWPYVQERLDKLHSAEKAYEAAFKDLWERELKLLDQNKGPADFYKKYRAAGKDEQHALVQQYVNGRLKDDPRYVSAQEALHREEGVVPVAMDLGIVMLQRAQGQADVKLRKTQLESAEKVFLAIGGIAGETDEYRLSLGQVYYWLGKQAEGRKLFDEFLSTKGRDAKSLLAIAVRLRELGAVAEARTMAEDAYSKATKNEERYPAASFRALMEKDSDDEIEWLKKADTASPVTKARLANAMGNKALTEGRDSEAATQFRLAVDAYNAMPRSAGTLNQTACAWYSIFRLTGDRQTLDRCFDNFQQALDLSPTDPILLHNAADTIVNAALGDIIGADIDLQALHEMGEFSTLSYLYQDQAGRQALAKRVKEHPGIARALSYYEKLMVLSPRSTHAYASVSKIYMFTRNQAGMDSLAQRVKNAEFDTADALTKMKEFITGAKDEVSKLEIAAAVKRAEETVAKVRPKGGLTLAVALGKQAESMIIQDMLKSDIDPRKIVELAEEARKLSVSAGTSSDLTAAYMFRAFKDLCRGEPAVAGFRDKYQRSLGLSYLMAAGCQTAACKDKLLQNADVQKALSLLREGNQLFPEDPSLYEWALLKEASPAEAQKLADAIRKNQIMQAEQSISIRLHPHSPAEAMDTCWLMQICGKADESRAPLQRLAELGIPVPQ